MRKEREPRQTTINQTSRRRRGKIDAERVRTTSGEIGIEIRRATLSERDVREAN
jgi:hypothetical protein